MIFDHRTYTCRPGAIKKQLALYEEFGWPVQTRILGEPLLYAMTETGDVNSYTHIWVYESAADREQKRAALQQEPEWIEYLRRSAEAGYQVTQQNQILTPASFSAQGRAKG